MTLRRIYDALFGKHPHRTILSWNYLFTRKNIQWVKKYAKELSGKVILDYRCGKMPYYQYFEPYCDVYYGLDFPASLPKNNDKAKAVYASIKPLQMGMIPASIPKAYLIVSFEVIMEVDDLDAYFLQMNNASKPETKILLTSPWGLLSIGHNDKLRIAPFKVVSLLNKYGYTVVSYKTSGYFFSSVGVSLNLLLVTKNKYDIFTSLVEFSKIKLIIFTPVVFVINVLSLVFDAIAPMKKAPANFMIIAQRGKDKQ